MSGRRLAGLAVVGASALLPRTSALEASPTSSPTPPHVDGASVTTTTATVRVDLPALASDETTIEDLRSGIVARVSIVGATRAASAIDGGAVVFERALGEASVRWTTVDSGVEDFVSFPRQPPLSRVRYRLATNGAGLRLVSRMIEIVDAGGAPRLRMRKPWIRGADGRVHDVAVTPLCPVDTDPRAPWGRPVVASGSTCDLELSWEGTGVVYPAELDPAWTSTSAPSDAHWAGAMCLLGNGRPILAGGFGPVPEALVEIFDFSTATWAVTTDLPRPRSDARCATLLDGRVLFAGGSFNGVIGSSDVYDATTEEWTSVAMNEPHAEHALVVLLDGRVAALGGIDVTGAPNVAIEVFDPKSFTWAYAGTLTSDRQRSGMALLPDGRVLIAGGAGPKAPTSACELYDPVLETSVPTTSMHEGRETFDLVSIGPLAYAFGGSADGSVESFDPSTSAWTLRAPMPVPVHDAAIRALGSGNLLQVGGYDFDGAPNDGAFLYAPTTDEWLPSGTVPSRSDFHMAPLPGGRALIVGGLLGSTGEPDPGAMIFVPQVLGRLCTGDGECTSLHCVDGVCCESACDGTCASCDAEGACSPVVGAPDPGTCDGESACNDAGECSRAVGQPCATGAECASTFCADGFCCDAACTGTCEACDGVSGRCGPVVGEPHGDRVACSEGFVCTGSEPECVALSVCEEGRFAVSLEGVREDCAPFACRDGVCRLECVDYADCLEPLLCDTSGQCVEPTFQEADPGCNAGSGRTGGAVALASLALFGVALRRRRASRRRARRSYFVGRGNPSPRRRVEHEKRYDGAVS